MSCTSVMVTFDTNVLLYSADRRDSRKQQLAIETIHDAKDAVLLWQVACEFIAASRRLTPHGLTLTEAWDILAGYLGAFRLVIPSNSALEHARRLQVDRQWSFWDALLVGACLEAGVTRLYSEDLPGQAPPPPLIIINPFG